MDMVADLIDGAEAQLTAALAEVCVEIAAYPTPIAGCDAQFNHLLSLRSKLHSALEALGSEPFVPTPRMPAPADRLESR